MNNNLKNFKLQKYRTGVFIIDKLDKVKVNSAVRSLRQKLKLTTNTKFSYETDSEEYLNIDKRFKKIDEEDGSPVETKEGHKVKSITIIKYKIGKNIIDYICLVETGEI